MPGSEVAIDAVSSVESPFQGNNNAGMADTTAPAQAAPKPAAPPSPKSVSYEVAGAPTPGGGAPTPAARSADVCSSLRETSVSSRSLSKGVGVLGKVVSTKRLTRQLSSSSNLVTKYKDPGVKLVAEQIRRFDRKLVPTNRVPWQRRCVIDPRTSAWIGWWDGIMSLALVFTGIVTPVEVGFMAIPDERWVDPLFIINRFVDLVFLFDLGLQCVLMIPQPYKGGTPAGGAGDGDPGRLGSTAPWVDDVRQISRHYVFSGWFLLDFFSIGVSAFDIFAPEDSSASRFKAFRALRVLRMLKLLRLGNQHFDFLRKLRT